MGACCRTALLTPHLEIVCYIFKGIFYFMCMSFFFYLHVCKCTVYVSCAPKSSEAGAETPGTGFQMVLSYHTGSGN